MSLPNPGWKDLIAYGFKRLYAKNASELQAVDWEIEDKFTADADVDGRNFEEIEDLINEITEEARFFEIKSPEEYFATSQERDQKVDQLRELYKDMPYMEMLKLAKSEGKLNLR